MGKKLNTDALSEWVDTGDFAEDALLPLESWDPPDCGDCDIFIDASGYWWHEGTRIQRKSLMRLFSRILWREAGQYYLKTPVEKFRIQVKNAPLSAVLLTQKNTYLWAELLTGEQVRIDACHPLVVNAALFGDDIPHILIRRNLYARVTRNVLFQLVELAEETDTGFQVYSGDDAYSLM